MLEKKIGKSKAGVQPAKRNLVAQARQAVELAMPTHKSLPRTTPQSSLPSTPKPANTHTEGVRLNVGDMAVPFDIARQLRDLQLSDEVCKSQAHITVMSTHSLRSH